MNLNDALQWAAIVGGFADDEISHIDEAAVVLAAEVRRLQAEVEALETLCNDLEEFAQHDPGCDLLHGNGKCDCGLLSTLKRLNERAGL